MDADLIKLVNKLQDTFSNLGPSLLCHYPSRKLTCIQAESWTCPSSLWYVYPRGEWSMVVD